MEYYNRIFGDITLHTLRGAQVKTKKGTLTTLAKLIYNGFSYNFGTIDGAVTIADNYKLWRFIAPASRWSIADFSGKTLSESLRIVGEDSATVPVVAWDSFCAFLTDPEIEVSVNQVLHGKTSSIKIAYQKTDLPFLQGITDFPSFAKWLYGNTGEAGDMPTASFTSGQNIIIPADMYVGTPVSFTLKTPTEKPTYVSDVNVLKSDSCYAAYTTSDGSITNPVFICDTGAGMYMYAFEEIQYIDGLTIPIGWSVYGADGLVPYDMEANPVIIPYTESMEWTYLAKAFTDIQWATTGEKKYRVKSTIDLSAFSGKEFAYAGLGTYDGFECSYEETDVAYGLALVYGTETDQNIYYYLSEETEIEDGVIAPSGWSILVQDDSEVGYHLDSYDMDENPLILSVLDGQYEAVNESLFAEFADLIEDTSVIKEELDGTITFVFTF